MRNGKWCCSKHYNSCTGKIEKDRKKKLNKIVSEETKKKISKAKKGQKPWNLGKTYEEIWGKKKASEYRKKISDALLGNSGIASTESKERERRRKISEKTKERYANGWQPKAGRCKKIKYKSEIAGDITLDGSWELDVAKTLDENCINWTRNKNRFEYYYDGKSRFYTPDFFLVDLKIYLEVKGYQTEKDIAKWNYFNHSLSVFKKEAMKKIWKQDYGNFVDLIQEYNYK